MVKVEKKLLEEIVWTVACKNRDLKNCWVIEERSIGGNCKDGFMNKLGVEERNFSGDCVVGCMYN